MSEQTLFLAWQGKRETSRRWFPIGRLDANMERPHYRFRYVGGIKKAQNKAGFQPLLQFPDLKKAYCLSTLFPIFRNRVMSDKRPDFAQYISSLGLAQTANPIEILAVSGGRRVTDNFGVFPKINKRPDGSFTCRFFLHGWSHVSEAAKERIKRMQPDEPLYLTLDLTNPATRLAVQIQTTDYHMVGWAPRYLVGDLVEAMAKSPEPDYSARVVQVNPMPVPSNHRVLIEMQGCWNNGHEPMSGPDFQPLVD